jgi:hypothetical protein
MDTNLLQETIDILAELDLKPTDVYWVGTRDGAYGCSWEDFALLANREYYSGHGTVYVCLDLVIVGDGWWLERLTYDGDEEWAYKTAPQYNPRAKPVTSVFQS